MVTKRDLTGSLFATAYLAVLIMMLSSCGVQQLKADGKIDDDRLTQTEKPRIAFIPFDNTHPVPEMHDVEKRLRANIEAELQRSGCFVIVERERLESILEEHRLSQKGITQTLGSGKKLPSLEGLDYLVTGTLSGDALSTEAVVKFITVGKRQPGIVVYTFTARGITTPAISPIIQKLVSDISVTFQPDVSAAEPQEKQVDDRDTAEPETLIAIQPFENYTNDPGLDWIGRGISESLTTALNSLRGFRLVERQQLDQILGEQRLQASALFDPETIVETGKLWKCRYIIVGGYQKLGDFYRLDGRRLDTETGEVFDARGIRGQDLFALQEELGEILLQAIDRSRVILPRVPSAVSDISVAIRKLDPIPTSIYHLLTTFRAPLVEYTLENTVQSSHLLSVVTEIVGFTEQQRETVNLSASGVRLIHHTPVFQTEHLVLLAKERKVPLHLRITDLTDGVEKVVFEQQQEVTLLPNDMLLWSIESADGQHIDLLPALAAWVSPNSPAIAKLLREAADYTPSRRIAGYQNSGLSALSDSDETQIQRQRAVNEEVRSIYQILQETYQLRYIDQSTQYPSRQGQRILLPEKTLATHSANCIDGTILMASILYRAGIHPIIVIVPGHAFLGWETWPDTGSYQVLETTQISIGDFDTALTIAWEQAEKANIAISLRQGINFGRSGEAQIGQAKLLDVWTLKERNHITEIPMSITNK